MPVSRLSWIFGLCLVVPLVGAEPRLTPGDRDLIRDRQDRLLQEQQRRLEELQQLPGEEARSEETAPVDEGHCIEILRIDLQGAAHLAESRRDELLAPFLGRCLGTPQLNELLRVITGDYLDRGYVTSRAYLPQQDLADGQLEIIVIEGRLEGLDSSAMATDRELAMAFPGSVGDLLDLRELEQLVDQLNRLPSRPAQLELLPGEHVGGSRVSVQGQPEKAWRVSATRHNDGDIGTGEQQMGLGFDWDSPLGLADQFSLRTSQDAVTDHWRHSDSQSASYGLPWGWWTFAYHYSQSYYRMRHEGTGFPFVYDGGSRTQQWSAERVLHRDGLSKTGVSLAMSHYRTRNYVDGSLIATSSNRLTEQQLGFNHGRRVGSAFINLDIGWQRGSGALDAQAEGNPHGSESVARYNKYSATLSYLQPFQLWDEPFSFDSLAHGQRSEDVLFSPQRISLGGLSSVRGFKDQSLSGDTGGYWRNQVRWRRPIAVESLRPWFHEFGLAFAYDLGVIHGGPHNPEVRGRMSGNAFEFSLSGTHLAASASFARSLERPDIIEDRERPIYFRLDAFF